MAATANMMARVQKDVARINSTDFATDILLTPPSTTAVTVRGFAGKHYLGVDPRDGFIKVNTQKAYVGISESNMIAAGLVTRDSNSNLISFEGWLASWTDVSGLNKTYKVQQGADSPNETVGLINLQLGYYKP